ncbi:class I SAM-dependent methyltransferase [Francisella noatunensis]|uniref:Class I SAM-dependent methyltransferase n=1 Tax=Francisella noatunensis TaxID=657445 RepID=A0A9Q2QDP9_9GAMM|nr:class I SAM-dependent methyltransferase [Francisella noatunensis]MBK2028363.1 class I SAM-dependent methyltransferase [Francisella noatunensis]MBK2033251.1 class I SAM-dependent methyltransferase [Francisella noatunensis]MBK2049241.1 class I SAM-dependent methyltransferase [Francisella noatunensis]MBK2050162.1 class I SAM-dependent methyltransferase [Francisella noatunensis]MBK2051419.1 class I SAM-dependent methyltransferase [Francisella noatunensis]
MNKSTHDGQKVYSKLVLKLYNFVVLFFNNTFLWKCKTSQLLQLYKDNVSPNHLDIGVGSGYYLKNVKDRLSKVALMDLNPNCLEYVKNVLKDKEVSTYQVDILKDVAEEFYSKYDSISCNYLIHCLPDNGNKEKVFENIAKMLSKDGVAFGSTIINDYSSSLAIKVANKFNAKGIFDNKNDTYESIEKYLESNFAEYTIKQIGSVCVYVMSKPLR